MEHIFPISMDYYHRPINITKLDEHDDQYNHKINCKIPLKPHQLTLLNKCLLREQKYISDLKSNKYESMYTDVGVIADKVGSGKSFVILSMILSNSDPLENRSVSVTYGSGNLSLAVEASPDTRLDVRWNGSGTFTFPSYSQVRNVAVFSADLSTLYGYWKLNKIPFGASFTSVNGGIPAETGAVTTVLNVTGTSSQSDGSYTAVGTSATNGIGATLNFTVASGSVSAVSVSAGGSGYPVGETLTVTGHGFTVDVSAIS